MSPRPTPIGEVPAATAAVARAAFPRGNRCLDLRDALGCLFEGEQFKDLFAVCGRPAECPWRLALVTLLQFGPEPLGPPRGRGRARAHRLEGPPRAGTDRPRLRRLGAERAQAPGLLRAAPRRSSSTPCSSFARERGWLEQTRPPARRAPPTFSVRCDLSTVSTARSRACARRRARSRSPPPAGFAPTASPAWASRYAQAAQTTSTRSAGRGRATRLRPERVGHDGHALLAAVMAPDAPSWLREVPAVEMLRRAWVQTFTLDEGDGTASRAERSVVRWRTQVEGFPSSLLMVASPYDPEVHYGPRSARRPPGSAARSI